MDVRAGTVLSVALLAASCASRPPGPGYAQVGMELSNLPPIAETHTIAQGPSDGRPRAPASQLRNGAVGSTQQGAALTRWAVLRSVDDLTGSTARIASALARLEARSTGIGGANGAFSRHLAFGSRPLPSLEGALADSTVLVGTAAGVVDVDMELAVLRMTGPRLEAAMLEAILLATWVDFLSLTDAVLQHCPVYGVERLFVTMNRLQRLIEPSMAALASQDPVQVEAAALAMPELMGQLTHEYASIRDGARVAVERSGQAMALVQLIEMATMMSALKMSLARLPPSPPAVPVTLGAALVMGSNGVMVGSHVVVSAEWVEMVRRLVQAGIISLPAVSAAVRIHAGQVMMAQANGDLPQGVRDALGDGPEVRGMHQTGKAGAGMAEAPRHHVLPQEHRSWFEQRGFKGAMDIDNFCVRMERAKHEAIHGGGNWRLGRIWPEEWSQRIMAVLRTSEAQRGRMLTPGEIMQVVAVEMKNYRIPMAFIRGRAG